MNAILITEMPKSCDECKFCIIEDSFWGDITSSKCFITDKDNLIALVKEKRLIECPLKPLNSQTISH